MPDIESRFSAAPAGTRTWTLAGREGAVDVEVTAPDDGVLADVLPRLRSALAGATDARLWAGSTPLGPETPLTAAALRHGALLGLDQPGPHPDAQQRVGALELQVTAGPDAGRAVPLGQRQLLIGRGGDCGVQVADPDVSRRHAAVEVSAGRVTVRDLGSSNGTLLTGGTEPLPDRPVDWPVGAAVLVGATAVRLGGAQGLPLDRSPAPAGRVHVRGLRSARPPLAETVVALPAPPPEQPRRRLGVVAVALPTVGGLLMAWLFATPQFLFFALLSPLVAVGTWGSDRLSGRRAARRAEEDHAAALAAAEGAVEAAVAAEVSAREELAPDLGRLAAAVRRRSSPLFCRSAADEDALVVRLGAGPGPTRVVRSRPGGERTPVDAARLPLTTDLARTGGLAVTGPRGPVLGVARSLVCQLATLLAPADLQLVLVTTPDRSADWGWARWLPHLRDTCAPDRAAAAVAALLPPRPVAAGGAPSGAPVVPTGAWTVVLVDGLLDDVGARDLVSAITGRHRVVCLELAATDAALSAGLPVRLAVTGELGTAGRLSSTGAAGVPGAGLVAALDGVSARTAAELARALAPLDAAGAGAATLPDTVRLLDLAAAPAWTGDRQALRATLGADAGGPVTVDLVAQGPHALVAGTTGSGKSELLQTLVASLALHHPPDRCSFLLVDYKGGAAFAEAAALPHTVGLLTDLDGRSTERALRSLTAELTRREHLLADHRVRDLTGLPGTVPLARLVIVVDEFATLAEDHPGFLSGLVGIAQRGRSLGVHLVLATQRPAGVVSPEIRANTSLRICLRTTDDTDARDVLGSALPAGLPADRPGRAYLRAGNAAPLLLQVARASGTGVAGTAAVDVRRAAWPAVHRAPAGTGPGSGAAPAEEEGDLARLVRDLQRRAAEEGRVLPDRPWLPPLPDRLTTGELDEVLARCGGRPDRPELLALGLVDRPDRQAQEPLLLDLAAGGSWLLVGGPRSGRTSALRAVLGEAVHRLGPDQLHVHVLDAADGAVAATAGDLPHTGTAVPRDDTHRSVRLVARLLEEVDRRRSGAAAGPPVLLLVDGLESLLTQLDEADPATGSSALLRLVRDGAAAGLTSVLTAERAVPGGRVAAAAATRLVLPLPDRADYAVAGIAPRSVPSSRPAGRALLGEDPVECQLVLPREPLRAAGRSSPSPLPGGSGPVRLVPLPADPALPLPGRPVEGALRLPLGPGGDEGLPVEVDLLRGGGLLVAGPPGSGRSAALRAFGAWCTAAGLPVLTLTDEDPTATPAPAPPGGDTGRLGRWDADGLRQWATACTAPAVVLVDDVGTLPGPVADVLAAAARPAGPLLPVVAGSVPDLAATHRGPVVALRRSRTVLLLRPATGEPELLGLRVPRTPLPPRPGAGWLVTGGTATRVQVARHRPAPARDPGRGPTSGPVGR